MRKLHLVGLTTDRDGLIFTARKGSKSGGFIVPLDDKVLAAIDDARERPNGAPADVDVAAAADDPEAVPRRLRSQSALTPREMQVRLRAGRSIEEVAAEAGVDTEWVARFAVPILAEQAQVVELARGLVYAKPRLGESSQPLGASVVQNLSDRGIFIPDDVAHAAWSAFQLHDSVWMVRFRYRSRGRDQEAQWEIDVPAGRLVARNRHASDLGYVDPGRRRRDVEPEEDGPGGDAGLVASGRSGGPVARDDPMAKVAAAAARLSAPRPPARTTPARAATARPPARRSPAAPARKAASGRRKAAAPSKGTAATRSRAKAAPAKASSSKASRVRSSAGKSAAKASAAKASAAKASASKASAATSSKAGSSAPRSARGKAAATKAPADRKAAAPSPATAGPARSPSRRRPAKAAPPADAGPTGGTGGVRMAVQQVSTARVAASMASADRAPWAAAVRRAPASGAPATGQGNGERTGPRRPSPSPVPPRVERRQARDEPEVVSAFQPRPLPAGGGHPVESRVRRVTTTRQPPASDGQPTMSLPARRRPAVPQEPLPVERAKRRRLRSR